MGGRVLVVDDDEDMRGLLRTGLSANGCEVIACADAEEAVRLFAADDFDAIVTDLRMRGVDGIELCKRIVECRPDVPVIVITAFGTMETAIEAIRAGAYDFVTKPFELERIRLTVARAMSHRELGRTIRRLQEALERSGPPGELVGTSPAMLAVYDLVDRVADTDTTVLISGESGTGKELVARALHTRSRRKAGPFVALNCAAMPSALLESELFGHVKGAFTDANANRAGVFRAASGGTLLLDEVGELPLELQPKLLRALQERAARPVGGTSESPFDTRIIAATNRDLRSAVEAGSFREDLYYRIHVIEIEVPPLRVRGDDVLVLAQHFLRRFATGAARPVSALTTPVADKLRSYPWPGNVRELQNCIERAVALARFSELTVDDLPERIREHRRPEPLVPADIEQFVPLEEIERRYVLRVFEATGGNKSMTARILGLDRKTLYRRLLAYGLSEPGAEGGD